MKPVKEIRREYPYYFVSIKGENLFESADIEACKEFLIGYIKHHKQQMIEEDQLYNYFIGMYSIDIM